MCRIDARQIVPPEAELRDRKEARKEDSTLQHDQTACGREKKDERNQYQPRHLKDAQKLSAIHYVDGEERKKETAHQPARLLNKLHRSDDLLLLRPRQIFYFRQTGDDLR